MPLLPGTTYQPHQGLPAGASFQPYQGTSSQPPKQSTAPTDYDGDGDDSSDGGYFQPVSNRRRLDKDTVSALPQDSACAVTVNNAFAALDTLPTDGGSTEHHTQVPPRQYKVPPVIIKLMKTHQELIALLDSCVKHRYELKPTGAAMKVTLSHPEDYRSLTDVLNAKGLEYHTFPGTRSKPQVFVIRGLPVNTATTDISNELKQQGMSVQSVSQITSQHNNKDLFPLFKVVLSTEPGKQRADLTSIKHMMHCRVSTESVRSAARPTMCFACQRLGHTAAFCHQKLRCVICGGEHDAKQCSRAKEDKATCVNCSGPHPASYRGCPYLQQIRTMEQRQTREEPRGSSNTQQGPRPSQPFRRETSQANEGRSYAQVAAAAKPPPTTSTPLNNISDPTTPTASDEPDLTNIMGQLSALVADLRPLILALTQLLPSLVSIAATLASNGSK